MGIKRAFRDQSAAICFSCNDAFAPYTAVMLQSIIEHSNPRNSYDIVLLASSLSVSNHEKLNNLFFGKPNFSFRVIDSNPFFEGYDLFVGDATNTNRLTADAYARLFIPRYFQEYSRVIYLDGDMVSKIDVALFYEIDFEGKQLISSRDLWGTCNCYMENDPLREYREKVVGMQNIDEYFISGMIVFNIDLIPETATDDLIALSAEKSWKHHDQDVLNRYFQHKTKLIDASWDYLSDKYNAIQYLPNELQSDFYEAQAEPKIVHYGGSRKPWKYSYQENDLVFWAHALNTPFFWEIMNSRDKALEYKSYILNSFGLELPKKEIKKNNIAFMLGGNKIGLFSSRTVSLEFCEIVDSCLRLEGVIPLFGLGEGDEAEVFARCGERIFSSVSVTHGEARFLRTGELRYRVKPFAFMLELSQLESGAAVEILCSVNGVVVSMKNAQYAEHCAIQPTYINSYQYKSGYILQPAPKGVVVRKASEDEVREQESRLLNELSTVKNYSLIKELRKSCFEQKGKEGKEIWLFSDRTNKADDNGEAMFRYVVENHSDSIDAYFVLREDSPDYGRLARIGRVVPYLSKEHKLLHLLCKYNLSAQADAPVFLPFDNVAAFCGLLRSQRFIFLQHGVIKNDISRWFNRINLDPWIFVTSARRELDSIAKTGRYCLDESVLKLTGLPRHDLLHSSSEKMITIMPTWRIKLCERKQSDNGVWHVKKGFENSQYCRFFTALLRDERLIAAAKQHGYKLAFMPHPNIAGAIDSFSLGKDVLSFGVESSYREVFARSSLVVTDYSSSVMDFAYLRKPIVYTHFDYEDFFSGVHVASKGYFDDERDGFGPVTTSLDELVGVLIEYINNDCQISPKYKDRIEAFFAFHDQKSRQRIFGEIKKKESLPLIQERSELIGPEELGDLPKPIGAGIYSYTKISKTKMGKCDAQFGIGSGVTTWKRKITKTLPVFVSLNGSDGFVVSYAEFKKGDWLDFAPAAFEGIDPRAYYVAYIAQKAGNSIPYHGDDWSRPIRDCYIGVGWREVEGKYIEKLQRGDVVSFKNGVVAIVLDNAKGKYIFTYAKLSKGFYRVYRGGINLSGKAQKRDELPAINWVLRRLL